MALSREQMEKLDRSLAVLKSTILNQGIEGTKSEWSAHANWKSGSKTFPGEVDITNLQVASRAELETKLSSIMQLNQKNLSDVARTLDSKLK